MSDDLSKIDSRYKAPNVLFGTSEYPPKIPRRVTPQYSRVVRAVPEPTPTPTPTPTPEPEEYIVHYFDEPINTETGSPVTESVPSYWVYGGCSLEWSQHDYYNGVGEISLVGVSGTGCVTLYPFDETIPVRKTKYAQIAFRGSIADYTPGYDPDDTASFVELQIGTARKSDGIYISYTVRAALICDYLKDEFGQATRIPNSGRIELAFSVDDVVTKTVSLPGLPDPSVDTCLTLRFDKSHPQVFVNGTLVFADMSTAVDYADTTTASLAVLLTSGMAVRGVSVNRDLAVRAPVECIDETLLLDSFVSTVAQSLSEHTPEIGGAYPAAADLGVAQLEINNGVLSQTSGSAFFDLPIIPNTGRTTVFHIEIDSLLPLRPFGLGLYLKTDTGTYYFNYYNSGDTVWQVGVSQTPGILDTARVGMPVLLGKHRLSLELSAQFGRLVMYIDGRPVLRERLAYADGYIAFGIQTALNNSAAIDTLVCNYVNECYKWPDPMEPGRIVTPVTANPRTIMTVTCEDIITLDSALVGDPAGHTFEWQQDTGTAVEWLEDRFQQDVMFRQPGNVRDDKVFTFYIDRGLPEEQSYKVLVTSIPTDFAPLSAQTHKSLGAVTPSITLRGLLPALGPAGSLIENGATRIIGFDTPFFTSDKNFKVRLLVYNNGVFGVAQEIDNPVGATYHFNNVPTNRRVKLEYELTDTFGNRTVLQTAEVSQVSPNTGVIEHAVVDRDALPMPAKISPASIGKVLEVKTAELVPFIVYDSDAHTVTAAPVYSASSVLQVITRELVKYTMPTFDTHTVVQSAAATTSYSKILEIRSMDYGSLG